MIEVFLSHLHEVCNRREIIDYDVCGSFGKNEDKYAMSKCRRILSSLKMNDRVTFILPFNI